MYIPLTRLLLLGTLLSRVTAQDDDDDDDDGTDLSDDDDGNGFGAVDEGIGQLDTQQSCDLILNQCPGGFPASACSSLSLPLPIMIDPPPLTLGSRQSTDMPKPDKSAFSNGAQTAAPTPTCR